MSITRVVAMGDPHCGHLVGLTPPAWQQPMKRTDTTKRNKYAKVQRELWHEYKRLLKSLEPINHLLFLGDAIDGDGKKSGGTELITTDRQEQSDMAVECINQVRCYASKKYSIVGVFGTGYHTGNQEDWENRVAEQAGFAKIGSHEWPSVNGCVFDIKHKVGSSTIPHGRGTAVLKEMLWNDLWSKNDMQPDARIVIRGHAHYYIGIDTRDKSGFVLPALQGMGSKFGARQCSGIVDWGMMHFDIDHKGNVVNWDKHLVKITAQRAVTTDIGAYNADND
jgi:hypothetical protein